MLRLGQRLHKLLSKYRYNLKKINKNIFRVKLFYSSTITALFTNMQILKFKSQLTIAFFAAVSHLNGPLRKQNFTLTGSKGQGLWFVIGGFQSVLCVSVFQGSLLVIVIMIDSSEKQLWRRLLKFRVRMFVKSEVTHRGSSTFYIFFWQRGWRHECLNLQLNLCHRVTSLE